MPYSDLIVTPICTGIASDNTTFTVDDGTGTYDPGDPTLNPGGYSPLGEGTATRPELGQVIRCFMYRFTPLTDESLQRFPFPQPSLPATFANLSGAADRIIQVVLLVLPNSFSWEELLEDGQTWDQLIAIGYASGAVGQLDVWMDVNEVNCVYDALRRLNNRFPANCNMDEWMEKNAMFVGTAALMSVTTPLVPNSETAEENIEEIAAEIDELLTTCADDGCLCNC